MATFKATPGRWALYSGSSDAPFDDPRANLSAVHAHSDFDYIQFSSKAPTIDTDVFVPAVNNDLSRTVNIGAHGKSGIPFVFGRVLVGESWVPLAGSTPIFSRSDLGSTINFNLAVSDTDVAILETRNYPDSSGSLPGGTTRRVQIWVSDNIVDGTLPSLPDTEMQPGLFTAGRLDSRKFYLRRNAGASLRVSAGRTWTLSPFNSPNNTSQPWQAYRYDAGTPSTPINFTSTTVSGTTVTDNSPPTVSPVNSTCVIGGDVDPGGQVAVLEIDPGTNYARVVGSDGTVVLDSREEIFHILSKLEGSITRSSLQWGGGSGNSTSRSATINLGTVDPACTGILGLARITYSTGYSHVPSGYWLCVGGTIVTVMKTFQSLNGTWAQFTSSVAMLGFNLNAGQVDFEESIRLKDDRFAGFLDSLAGFTVTYRLFCGTFS